MKPLYALLLLAVLLVVASVVPLPWAKAPPAGAKPQVQERIDRRQETIDSLERELTRANFRADSLGVVLAGQAKIARQAVAQVRPKLQAAIAQDTAPGGTVQVEKAVLEEAVEAGQKCETALSTCELALAAEQRKTELERARGDSLVAQVVDVRALQPTRGERIRHDAKVAGITTGILAVLLLLFGGS